MSRKKLNPENPEDYYKKVGDRFMIMKSKESRKIYGHDTEPKSGLPTHQKILSTKELKRVQLGMLAKLLVDLEKNALAVWIYGTPLENKDSKFQPLGDYNRGVK